MMPINRKYPLAELVACLQRYPLPKRRRITLEYTLIAGVNDDPKDADKLADLIMSCIEVDPEARPASMDDVFQRLDLIHAMLLAGQDPEKVARANKANAKAYQPALEKIAGFDINWNIISWPGTAWALQVFPGEPEDVAVTRLADAIFAASRVDNDDPVAAWTAHNAALRARTEWLNGQRFSALRYSGPGTELTIGLADGHEWQGGASTAKNGIVCNPNIPTEEVFTTPHAMRVEGRVRSTKPLSYQGTLIDDIAVRFEGGRIVEATASRGLEVLNKVLDTDEGARRLGEVALVPHSSPISASGLLFYNTLFDENAACHIALGQCYSKCFVDGASLTPEQIAAQGGNKSLIHIDWMIGSGELDIDGVTADGTTVPVFRKGEWA